MNLTTSKSQGCAAARFQDIIAHLRTIDTALDQMSAQVRSLIEGLESHEGLTHEDEENGSTEVAESKDIIAASAGLAETCSTGAAIEVLLAEHHAAAEAIETALSADEVLEGDGTEGDETEAGVIEAEADAGVAGRHDAESGMIDSVAEMERSCDVQIFEDDEPCGLDAAQIDAAATDAEAEAQVADADACDEAESLPAMSAGLDNDLTIDDLTSSQIVIEPEAARSSDESTDECPGESNAQEAVEGQSVAPVIPAESPVEVPSAAAKPASPSVPTGARPGNAWRIGVYGATSAAAAVATFFGLEHQDFIRAAVDTLLS